MADQHCKQLRISLCRAPHRQWTPAEPNYAHWQLSLTAYDVSLHSAGETMRHHEGGPSLHETLQSRIHDGFALRIQR